MAPVKRSTSSAQREVRSTRAATVAKRKVATTEKTSEPVIAKRAMASTAKPAASTRGSKHLAKSETVEEDAVQDQENENTMDFETAKPVKPKTTRSTTTSAGLAAAPRRRLKVTPLNAPAPITEKETIQAVPEDTKSKNKEAKPKTKSTRSKTQAIDLASKQSDEQPMAKSRTRSSRNTATKSAEEQAVSEPTIAKTRGRSRTQKLDDEQKVVPAESNDQIPARTTRSNGAGSVLSEAAAPVIDTQVSTAGKASRKKVTFQGVPDEDDKENLPLSKSKAKAISKPKVVDSTKTTGMRAKPMRKPAGQTTVTRGRKSAAKSSQTSRSADDTHEEATGKQERTRALTPKKITQVAKSSSPEHEEVEVSDGEDELNGGKTPIRDLSVSPRRPTTAALVRALSPVKKLDLTQRLIPKSPERAVIFRDVEADPVGVLASPARRPAASPFKDSLKESPRRGISESTKVVFPHQHESTISIAFNASANNPTTQSMSTMLQSPKRAAVLDPSFFSQSAMKKSASKSPFKASLLGTPAKRLFSPAKKSATPIVAKPVRLNDEVEDQISADEMELESEVSASSHFRSSSSPLRVMRVEPRTFDLDFDDSIMQVRSPLKVSKSPTKIPAPAQTGQITNSRVATPQSGLSDLAQDEDIVEPASLMANQDALVDYSEKTEPSRDDASEQHDITTNDTIEAEDPTNIQKQSAPATSIDASRRTSLAQVLFRSNKRASDEESSEDELAGEVTPIKSYIRNANSRSRISTGIPTSVAGKGFGFTPLAAQMSGWLATSPDKSPEQKQNVPRRGQSTEFSPLARQHIDGEVMISRDSTPLQKLNKGLLAQAPSSSRTISSDRRSSYLRKSLAQRQSLGMFSSTESPARDAQFDEYMEIRALEEQASMEQDGDHSIEFDAKGHKLGHIGENEFSEAEFSDPDETILENGNANAPDGTHELAGDLTTDLIKFTHASDTAMVDFQKLAEEANEMASVGITSENAETLADAEPEKYSEAPEPASLLLSNASVQIDENSGEDSTEELILQSESPLLQPVYSHLESPSILDINHDGRDDVASSSPAHSSSPLPSLLPQIATPKTNLNINERRVINTVVSKVPLKPEGAISPIKMGRKRARSFGNSDSSPAKRISFEDLKSLQMGMSNESLRSPEQRARTSAAPSPGGTSTPAVRRLEMTPASQRSLGGWSAVTTPGQTSFAVDDFGDSTLDGIELPDDLDDTTHRPHSSDQAASPAHSVEDRNSSSPIQTPRAVTKATPITAQRSVRRVTTPATVQRKTPQTARRSLANVSLKTADERTPLASLGKGVLHGATVFVDVHTSEGADASGIFIELLNQMGAKCVKEWRWNSRASLAVTAENEVGAQKIGVTHVVFKDGSKRTLEKIRDAEGEVCCVGVAWVLDCERENKWLDEASYEIDTSIVPRGGLKRRKSMEPRALLISNDGAVSTSHARRSVSAEMTELMKRELINTPARGQSLSHGSGDDGEDENDENMEQSTPTGYVSYDPRIAMTPGTPYLVSQGKKLNQMSAPPKQSNKSLFADEDEENDDTFLEGECGNTGAVKDAKKFRMKNLGDMAKRRKTLGFKPVVGSPLSRI